MSFMLINKQLLSRNHRYVDINTVAMENEVNLMW